MTQQRIVGVYDKSIACSSADNLDTISHRSVIFRPLIMPARRLGLTPSSDARLEKFCVEVGLRPGTPSLPSETHQLPT